MDDPYPWFILLADTFGMPVFYMVNGLLILFLLFLSAMISGSEVAFFSLSPADVRQCRESSNEREKRVYTLLEHPKQLLATILILNNLVNIAIVTLATFVTWEIVGSKSTEGLLVASLTAAITFAILFFGEVIPKNYATLNNIPFAKVTAPFLDISRSVFRPFSWALLHISDLVERRVEKKAYSLSVDELNTALEITTHTDASEEEKGILKGIVNFGTISVKQVMKSRLDITAVDIEDDFHTLMDRINKSGFSRIPVYRETIDKIEGILYIKDLLPYTDREDTYNWQKLLRPGFFIPESKKIDSLLKDFQEKRVHMAIVVDEYGGTSGLITLEDVIEEIVGEINDEFDDEDIAYNKLDENTFVFEGKTSLNDFCKIIDEDAQLFEEVKGESESLGGLLLELNTKLPRAGDKITFDKFVFTAVAVDNRRIKRVRVLVKKKTNI
ncbi:gliding motility-associated protein GldE [Roseivirga sp. BDSF3-8]|uniref:gliding motility-associated protein GldE n=1 Tax=Roseivirga sp. BDSF3-8 TaxID=3241598 RepID=UPI0035318EEB